MGASHPHYEARENTTARFCQNSSNYGVRKFPTLAHVSFHISSPKPKRLKQDLTPLLTLQYAQGADVATEQPRAQAKLYSGRRLFFLKLSGGMARPLGSARAQMTPNNFCKKRNL